MAESWSFERPERFTCGTVGEPGQRTFYLQVRDASGVLTVKAEKEQVRILGQYLEQVTQQLGPVDPDRDVVGLLEPVDAAFVVGDVGVATDADARTVVIVLEELPQWSGEDDLDEATDLDELLESEETRSVTVTVPIEQAAAFAEVAADLVGSGRPPCRLCGAPLDPTGHACPRWN